jgi:hypothetical protein
MENNQPKNSQSRTQLILLLFVLLGMGLILAEMVNNVFSHLFG